MQTMSGFGSDADVAELSEIVSVAEAVVVAVAAAQVAEVRMLARAGQLAETQTAGSPTRVKDHDMALRSIAAEVAGVVRVTDRTVQRRIGEAREIVECYPATLSAWETGRINRGHVNVIVEHGRVVPVEVLAEFEAAAIELCEGNTPNRVRSEVEMLAQRMHPRTFQERHTEAAAGRCVKVLPGRDGMSDVVATLPTVIAAGVSDRLTQLARTIVDDRANHKTVDDGADGSEDAAGKAFGLNANGDAASFVGDTRTMDQVRADVFADLLLAGAPALDPTAAADGYGALGAIRAQVQIVIPATTLMGTDDGPADLVGHAPIDAASARILAGNAPTWDRLLTHPVTGVVVECDQYRPTMAMRRLLRARDKHCRFPGCRRPAVQCEVDHSIDHALGGPTALTNLAHLCQRHHSVKQFTRWQVQQLAGGLLIWTSPTGRVYREDAPSLGVMFVTAQAPPGTAEPPPF